MKDYPLVSMVIPVYNTGMYLEQCFDSIVSQTYCNIEVIVINDGSTDDSKVHIYKYSCDDDRFVVINQNNTGLSASRNMGISYCSGDYIIFVDSDDWLEENYIERMLGSVLGHDLVVCSYIREFKNGSNPRVLGVTGALDVKTFQRRLVGPICKEMKDPSNIDSLVTVWGKIYRSDMIKDNNITFFSTKEVGTAEDLLFNLRYSSYISSVFVIDEPLYHYRKYNSKSFTALYKNDLFLLWKNLHRLIALYVDISTQPMNLAYCNRIAFSIIGLGLNEIKNPDGVVAILSNLEFFLKDQDYVHPLKRLSIGSMPIHWKIFFLFCKKNFTVGVYGLLIVMNYMINRKN